MLGRWGLGQIADASPGLAALARLSHLRGRTSLFAAVGGSSWQSIKRGTGNIEADYLNGEIVQLGRQVARSASNMAW